MMVVSWLASVLAATFPMTCLILRVSRDDPNMITQCTCVIIFKVAQPSSFNSEYVTA